MLAREDRLFWKAYRTFSICWP